MTTPGVTTLGVTTIDVNSLQGKFLFLSYEKVIRLLSTGVKLLGARIYLLFISKSYGMVSIGSIKKSLKALGLPTTLVG